LRAAQHKQAKDQPVGKTRGQKNSGKEILSPPNERKLGLPSEQTIVARRGGNVPAQVQEKLRCRKREELPAAEKARSTHATQSTVAQIKNIPRTQKSGKERGEACCPIPKNVNSLPAGRNEDAFSLEGGCRKAR